MEQTQKPSWQLMTIVVLGVVLAGLSGYVVSDLLKDRRELAATPDLAPVGNAGTGIPGSTDDAPDPVAEYMESGFKVVAVVPNPFYPPNRAAETLAEKSHALHVVAERGINDYACGGMYVPSTCYFFLEASYYDTPDRTFIGAWKNDFAVLQARDGSDAIRFVDANTIEFKAAGGDAGYGVVETWRLDLGTGTFTLLSKDETRLE